MGLDVFFSSEITPLVFLRCVNASDLVKASKCKCKDFHLLGKQDSVQTGRLFGLMLLCLCCGSAAWLLPAVLERKLLSPEVGFLPSPAARKMSWLGSRRPLNQSPNQSQNYFSSCSLG